MLKYVRMKKPGEGPGLTQKRHGVPVPGGHDRSWHFDAGTWRIMELTAAHEKFLREYRNQADRLLFDVADSEAEAVRIIAERKRALASSLSKQFPVAAEKVEGIAGTDDDLLRLAVARSAVNAAEEIAPKLAPEDEELLSSAEAAVTAEEKADDEQTRQNVIAMLSTYVTHEVAKAADEMFGEKLSWVMANDPDQLSEVAGIGKKTVEKIKKAVGNAR